MDLTRCERLVEDSKVVLHAITTIPSIETDTA